MRNICLVVLSVVLVLFCTSCAKTDSPTDSSVQTNNQVTNSIEQSDLATEDESSNNSIDTFVEKYNISANNQLVFNEEFIVADKQSKHYRTEFRLSAYANAIGKSYNLDNLVVDIISTKDYFGKVNIRIYADNASLDQCIEIIKLASPLLDPTIDTNTINEAVDHVSKNKEANGYYYGKLGLLLLGNDAKGYNLMIKMD